LASIGSITHNMAEASDYESEGRTFESFRARQHLAGIYRAKSYGVLRDLQGSDGGVFSTSTQRIFCGTGGRWFEPTQLYQQNQLFSSASFVRRGCGSG
jgi:hypothetical protein